MDRQWCHSAVKSFQGLFPCDVIDGPQFTYIKIAKLEVIMNRNLFLPGDNFHFDGVSHLGAKIVLK